MSSTNATATPDEAPDTGRGSPAEQHQNKSRVVVLHVSENEKTAAFGRSRAFDEGYPVDDTNRPSDYLEFSTNIPPSGPHRDQISEPFFALPRDRKNRVHHVTRDRAVISARSPPPASPIAAGKKQQDHPGLRPDQSVRKRRIDHSPPACPACQPKNFCQIGPSDESNKVIER